jgi:rhodanese-related sulfurtransferase
MHTHSPTILIDVRSPAEYAEGSIPGALNIPVQEIPLHISELMSRTPILVFCMSGGRSKIAQHILAQHGIKDVIDGGSMEQVRNILSNGVQHSSLN